MPAFVRSIKERAKNSLHTLFAVGQRLGFDILPRHFYSEIPDLRELKRSDSWRLPHSMCGIRGADVDQQLRFVEDCVTEQARTAVTQENIYRDACDANGAVGFGQIEAEFLFCFAGRHRPRKVIQVGAGVSTAVLLHAARAFDYHPEITCIDPYPTVFLKSRAANKEIQLIARRCQDVELSLYRDLGPGDLLFVDSTHTVKPGSEVNLLIMEVLPRLNSGCQVHFHDIYFPYDYGPGLMSTTFFWNETALLYALLTDSPRYSIGASLSMLHHARPEELRKLLPNYRPEALEHGLRGRSRAGHFPASTYIKVSE
jgi:hypothetical protein